MKSVLMSIKKQWIEKILEGEKTIEVRKTKPNLEVPFKVYIYCTKDNQHYDLYINEKSAREVYGNFSRLRAGQDEIVETVNGYNTFIAHGKVIGEFVCDSFYGITNFLPYDGEDFQHSVTQGVLEQTCLEDYEIDEYLGNKDGYGWHISQLKIYDKPKELYEFYPTKPKPMNKWTDNDYCQQCKYHKWIGSMKDFAEKGKPMREKCTLKKPEPICEYTPPITRPPQSWCYVEEK